MSGQRRFAFSMRQILVAVVALAMGLSIWRLPKGNWIDIPLATLSFYFMVSLCRHAMATRRLLIEHPGLSRQQRWSGRLLIVELLGVATGLIVAWLLGLLAAAEVLLNNPEDSALDYVEFPTLPRDLSALAMLAAVGLGSCQTPQVKAIPPRQRVYAAVAAAGALIGIIAYWADRMLAPFLVYLALSNVEGALSPRFVSPELNVSTAIRMHRFVMGSFAGLALAIVNLLLIAGLVNWWNKPRLRRVLILSIAGGLAAECWIARWLGGPGLWQLSPPFQEVIQVPPIARLIIVGSMVLLAVGAFSWRMLAKPAAVDGSSQVFGRTLFFHKSWLASLLLGVIAMISVVNTFISNVIAFYRLPYSRKPIDLQELVYCLTYRPAQLIWLAASIGGFTLAWFNWRRRGELLDDLLPCVNPGQFAVIALSLLIAAVAGAPIIAAVGFSFWSVRFGTPF